MNPRITLTNVTCRLSSEFQLDVAALELLPGTIYPLIGTNGSGKSTLLRILALLQSIDEGSICFPGRPNQNRQHMRRHITMVEQSPYLMTGSVADNVRFGLKIRRISPEQQHRLITVVLEQVGLTGFANRKTGTLSSGEKQRVALARALVLKPDLLLLDEPTANIDSHSVPQFEDLIKRLPEQGMTVVCATHDPEQPERLGGHVLRMSKGLLLPPV